ncbi:MAG: 4-hydroxy-tetrahydrodipicolinate reductase [Rhodospirillales bacterium]
MADSIDIGIAGVSGRMGRMLLAAVLQAPDCRLVAGSTLPDLPEMESDLGTLAGQTPIGIKPMADPAALFAASDLVIDFTAPEASCAHAALAAASGKGLVIGTTGMTPAQRDQVAEAAKRAPILIASNTSRGVTLLLDLVAKVARALDEDYDIEVVEMHHRMKVDAPSGTALSLGQAAADGRGKPLEELWVKSRDGHTGAREPGSIGFATLRGGDVVGEHSVIFAGPGERIEITHKAQSRELFAQGALGAARWLAGKPAGLYDMRDVLGLK